MALLVLALLVAVSALTGGAVAAEGGCPTAVPHGPEVPAPLVLRTSCGGYLLARDGAVSRLPQRWFDARAGGTGRRYGAALRVRRSPTGRIVLARNGRVVWRSAGLYSNDGGSNAFGLGAYAFAAYRRGVFVTDLRSPERPIAHGVGLYPLAFLSDGSLLVVRDAAPETSRWSWVSRVTQDGEVLRRFRYRLRNGYIFDEHSETLHLVTPGRVLLRVTTSQARAVRPLGELDGWLGRVGSFLTLSDFAHRGRSDVIRLAVLRNNGEIVSRWSWRSPRGTDVDYGPVVSPDGRFFAFRTVTRPHGDVVVYLVREGATRPVPVLRHVGGQLGCGVGADFSWKGRFALYSATDGPAAILDAGGARVVSLSRLQKALSPSGWERPRVSWASDYRRDDGRHA